MSDDRRFVISGAALCLAACPVSTSGIGSETSPRILRLRQLFARVDEFRKLPMGGVTDEDLEAVCNEIYDISNRVWQSLMHRKANNVRCLTIEVSEGPDQKASHRRDRLPLG